MTQVILATSGSGTWTVPIDCTSVTVDLLAAGADGSAGHPSPNANISGGGGGGQWARWTMAVTPGSVLNYQVGSANGGSGTPGSPASGDSWFGSPTTVFAQGGAMSLGSGLGGVGGNYTSSGAWARYPGGTGGPGFSSSDGGGSGGGGAAGPNGAGANGGQASSGLSTTDTGGGGGGGANGGSIGADHNSSNGYGGDGGANRLATGAGAGAAPGGSAGAGSGGGGGGGGGGGNTIINATGGAAGGIDAIWGSYGPGGGGGGGGGGWNLNGGNGGAGSYGAGGGGGGAGNGGLITTGGAGGQGLIVITYSGSGSADGRGRLNKRYVRTTKGPASPPPPAPTAPVNTGTPVMNQAVVGQVSTCNPGTWTGTAPITFAYQWKADGSNVGTNSPNYTPVTGDNGKSLKCTVTATNAAGSASVDSNAITVTTSAPAGSIDIPDATALNAAFSAWPSTGNKTWRLTGTDYGTIGEYYHDFTSAPVVIDGLGTARVEWMELAGTSGITHQNFTVYGTNPSSGFSIWVHSDTGHANDPITLTFNNVISDSGTAEGAQSGAGWEFRDLQNATITINGQGDATKPDIHGRGNGMTFLNCCYTAGSITVQNLTITNNGVDGIDISGCKNVTVNANLFKNFYNGAGDHPDAIQFYSAFDTGNACVNVTVTNNGVDQGAGNSSQGIFMEDVVNATIQNNWIHAGNFNNAISMSRGGPALIDNNFAQGIGATGGGVIISRGGTTNNTVTNNTASSISNYTADGVNPGYVPTTLPGTNTLISNATSVSDYAAFDTWKTSHPTARSRT